MNTVPYPFSAIVGQTAMKTVLLLNAVDPSLGGALITGHKGTGKSTAARALRLLLPALETVEGCPFNSSPEAPFDCRGIDLPGAFPREGRGQVLRRPTPFIELPLNATEDRLAGSLQIETALRSGKRSFEPGLLASANRGILYVDEVNLLDDHLVDLLLDAAASGINTVEREGISFSHPARFVLIGTMNPEEGELRPQFLDRFALCAGVETIMDPDGRELVVRRHLAFENAPDEFLDYWRPAERMLRARLVRARKRLPSVAIPDSTIASAVRLSISLKLHGHRPDLAMLKAARAHAALMDTKEVSFQDLVEAARLAIPHRLKTSPLENPKYLTQKIDRALHQEFGLERPSAEESDTDEMLDEMVERMQIPGSMAAGSILFTFLDRKSGETVHEPDPDIEEAEIDIEDFLGQDSRRSRSKAVGRRGRYVASAEVLPGERGFRVAIDATLTQAAIRRAGEGASAEYAGLESRELRKKVFESPSRNLIVFVVDSSESMQTGAATRIRAAKAAVLAMLRKAYQTRSEVALVAFGGDTARIILPPTSSIDLARPVLEKLATGGATPFADGLRLAWQIVRSERLKNPSVNPVFVVISDGEANVPLAPGMDTMKELQAIAGEIAPDRIPAVFIDAAAERGGPAGMRHIAERMGAAYVPMGKLTTRCILSSLLPNLK